MEARIINTNNRNANGFFLTSKKLDKDSPIEGEHAVLRDAVAKISAELKASKIRSGNIMDKLPELEDLVESCIPTVEESCEKNKVEEEGSVAYTWLVTVACLSSYHEKIRRIREKTE